MSRTVKVMGNHVVHDHAAKGNHPKHALCCLPSMKKQKHDFHYFVGSYIIKQLLDLVVVICRIIKVSVRVIRLSLDLFWISQKPHPVN